MQNPTQKFRQSSIVFEKPRILPENLTSSSYLAVQYFLLKLCTRFLLDLKLFAKIKKGLRSIQN